MVASDNNFGHLNLTVHIISGWMSGEKSPEIVYNFLQVIQYFSSKENVFHFSMHLT